MAKVTITNLPLDEDGHQFWVAAIDHFGNANITNMPSTGYVPFDDPETLTISNVTNIYTDYAAWANLPQSEQYDIIRDVGENYGDLVTPMIVVGLETTTVFFSHFEIEVDTVNTFDDDSVLVTTGSTYDGTTHTSRTVGMSGVNTTLYYFRARVVDTLGNIGAWSNIVSETCGDTTAPNEVGSANVDIAVTGSIITASVDLGTYTQADDHAYYEWWVNTSSTHPGGDGIKENDVEFGIANKSGQTLYFFVAAVDHSGNRSANYTVNVGNSPFVPADYWTDTGSVTDTSGDPIIDVTDRGIEDENGVTVIDFTSGTGTNANLEGVVDFGTGGKLLLTDNSVAFSGTPVDGTEIIARGMKLYGDADNYMIMEKTGTGAINVEIMGGTFKTGSSTSYLTLDSTGIKSYNASTQRVQILNDGSGWLGGATEFYWDSSGNVTIGGTVTVSNIAATTGTIADFTIAANSLTSTNIGIHSAGYTEGAEILLGHATLYASAKIGLKADGSGKVADGNFSWDASGNVTMAGSFTSTATITGGTIQTASSGARVVLNSSGIRAYNATVQTTDIGSNGSGWVGLTGDRSIQWSTAGVVTVAGWIFTDDLMSKIFDTDKQLRIRTTADQESIYFYDPTPGTGDVSFVGMGTLSDPDTGWTTETGIGMTVYNGSTHDKYFWLSDQGAEIAGWEFTDELFRSASSAERIQLNATENRVSIFDAVNEKVAMGYLDGLPKNPVYGWVTSSTSTVVTDDEANYTVNELATGTIEILEGLGNGQTRTVSSNTATTITISVAWTTTPDSTSKYKVSDYGDWTSADYGFWAREGDHLAIDGDVRYDNGDWIIQHDASYLVQDSSNNTIIRLGTDTGEKGLFTYNTSGTNLSKFVTDEIYIGDGSEYLKYTVAGGLEIVGDVTVSSYPSQPFDEDAMFICSFDGNALDQSGLDNHNNSSYGSSVTWTQGGVGGGIYALFPDGVTTDDFFRFPIDYSHQECTFTFWANSSDATKSAVFTHGSDSTGAFHFDWTVDRPLLYLGSSNYRYWVATTEHNDGEWHFWCVYIAGSAQSDIDDSELYIDNNQISSYSTLSTSSTNAWGDLYVGSTYGGGVQDFRVYNRQLTSGERIAIMTQTGTRRSTVISGDQITTGTVQSTNWSSTLGSQYDLNDGTFYLGGSSAPKLSWNGTTLSVTGAITISSGSGIGNLTDAGDLATLDNIDSSYITDVVAYSGVPKLSELTYDSPSGAGLYLDATHLGYHSGSAWVTYMDNTGKFYLGSSEVTTIPQTLSELLDDTPSSAGYYMNSTNLGFYNGTSWDVFMGSSGSTGLFYLGGTTGDLRWDGTDLRLGGSAKIDFGTPLLPGNNLLVGAEDWITTDTPVTYFTSGFFDSCWGDDDNNSIVSGFSPYGTKSLLWECDPYDGVGTSHGGWTSYDFTIDKTKRYRYTEWVKRIGTNDGNFYFGCQPSSSHTSDLTADGSDSGNSNPYFVYPDMVQMGSNKVTNGDCELTSGWTAVGTPTTNARSATQQNSGSYSWQITVNAAGEGTANTTGFTGSAQLEYLASFWLYGDGNNWQVYVDDGTERWYATEGTGDVVAPSASWTQYKIHFSPKENVVTGIKIYFVSAEDTASGTLYFDDVWIEENLVSDGGMEFDGDFWGIYGSPTAYGLSTTQKRSGTYSRICTVNGSGEGVQHTGISLKKGRQYRITAWLYGNGSLNWRMSVYDGTASYYTPYGSSVVEDVVVPAAWTKYDIDFVAGDDYDAGLLRFTSGTSNTSGTLYIDDVTIQETPWYLYVGYIHPSGYEGTNDWGGIFHYKTGQKLYAGADYKHMSTATIQEFRTFFHTVTTDYETNRAYIFSPKIHIVDGHEPSVGSILGNSETISGDLENSTNISAYLVSSPTIRGGDLANGNYVQMDENGIRAYGSGTNTFNVEASDGSVTIKSSDSGQRIEISGADNKLSFYNSTGAEVIEIDDGIGIDGDPGISLYVDANNYCYINSDMATLKSNSGSRQSALLVQYANVGNELKDVGAIMGLYSTSTNDNYYNMAMSGLFGSSLLHGATNTNVPIGAIGWGYTANSSVDSYGAAFAAQDVSLRLAYTSTSTTSDILGLTSYTDFKVDSSGYLNIVPSGDRLRLYESGGSDYTSMWTDTSSNFHLCPLNSNLYLWNGAEGSNDYTLLYTDASANFFMKPYGGYVNTYGTFRVWNVSGGAGDYSDFTSDTSGNLTITPNGTTCFFSNDISVTGNANVSGSYKIDSSDIIDSSGYQVGVLKTREFLLLGHDAGDTATSTTTTIYPYLAGGTAVANGQGYRMMRAGSITGVSCQFDVVAASTTATLRVRVYKNASTSTSITAVSANLGSTGDYGMSYTAAVGTETFSANDTLYCRLSLWEDDGTEVSVDDISIVVEVTT